MLSFTGDPELCKLLLYRLGHRLGEDPLKHLVVPAGATVCPLHWGLSRLGRSLGSSRACRGVYATPYVMCLAPLRSQHLCCLGAQHLKQQLHWKLMACFLDKEQEKNNPIYSHVDATCKFAFDYPTSSCGWPRVQVGCPMRCTFCATVCPHARNMST